jgi:hypothetical protein
MPLSSQATASPSIMQKRERRRASAARIRYTSQVPGRRFQAADGGDLPSLIAIGAARGNSVHRLIIQRGHSPDEIRRLAARAASARRRSANGNSLCGQNSAGFLQTCKTFKGIFCDDISEFESFSIGAGWCQALSDCSVDLMWDVTRRVLASLRDRHFGPPIMGSGGCGGPIYRGVLAVRLTAGIRDSKRTHLIHRPCGDIAPPVGGIHVFSCRVLLCITRCEIHERHKCALTTRSLLFARSR